MDLGDKKPTKMDGILVVSITLIKENIFSRCRFRSDQVHQVDINILGIELVSKIFFSFKRQ